MALRRIRTKAGRLTAGERRRRLSAASLQPGETIVLNVRQQQTKRGRPSKNSVLVEFGVKAQFSVDMDVRKLLHRIRLDLAEHFKASLLAGQKPDGFGAQPPPKPSTVSRSPGRPNVYGVLSGEMARRWRVLEIRGGSFAASVKITPYSGDGRDAMVKYALSQGVDFQTIEGDAAELIQAATMSWVQAAIPASGDGVGTTRQLVKRAGELLGFGR